MSTLAAEVSEHLVTLPTDIQEQILALVRTLGETYNRGVPGRTLLSFAGAIPSDDLALMEKAIEDECERVDADEW